MVAPAKPEPFDLTWFIIAWEAGELNEAETVKGFQHLIDTGMAWTLQGMYGRQAKAFIDDGLCHMPERK